MPKSGKTDVSEASEDSRTACQEEHKANKTYRQFYRQSAWPTVTISDLQRREAPLSTCNHC